MAKRYGCLTNHGKDLMLSKEQQNREVLVDFSPCRYNDNETKRITKHSEINPFVVKSVLEPNCKILGNTAIPKIAATEKMKKFQHKT